MIRVSLSRYCCQVTSAALHVVTPAIGTQPPIGGAV